MAYQEKTCLVCGKIFTPRVPNQVVCSLECKKEREHRLRRDREKGIKLGYIKNQPNHYEKKPKPEAKRITKPDEDILTANEKAAELGLTYGQYMAKRYFEMKKE